jgi:hypothetical protein
MKLLKILFFSIARFRDFLQIKNFARYVCKNENKNAVRRKKFENNKSEKKTFLLSLKKNDGKFCI